jgi:hypothetical protein
MGPEEVAGMNRELERLVDVLPEGFGILADMRANRAFFAEGDELMKAQIDICQARKMDRGAIVLQCVINDPPGPEDHQRGRHLATRGSHGRSPPPGKGHRVCRPAAATRTRGAGAFARARSRSPRDPRPPLQAPPAAPDLADLRRGDGRSLVVDRNHHLVDLVGIDAGKLTMGGS